MKEKNEGGSLVSAGGDDRPTRERRRGGRECMRALFYVFSFLVVLVLVLLLCSIGSFLPCQHGSAHLACSFYH